MKKKSFTMLAFILGIQGINAQITFTSNDIHEAKKTYVTKTDTTTNVNLGTASASSQNWDFSNLLMHYMSGPTFDSTSLTNYALDFPSSNLYTYGPAILFGGFHGGAPVSTQGLDKGYMFWNKNVTGFWTEGFMAEEGPFAGKKVHYNTPELILGTPATLGTSYQNNASWSLNFDINNANVDTVYTSSIEKTQTCDAWGGLTTPTGVYPSVIRIHEYGIKSDSVTAILNGNIISKLEITRDTFNNYIFVTNGIHYPIAHVKADKNNNIRSVEYYYMNGFASINDLESNEIIKIYPNPNNGNFTIEVLNNSLKIIELKLFQINGEMILEEKLINHITSLDLSSLESGIYYYQLMSENKILTGKITKQ